jgi:uncharacterized membrane protein
MAKLQASHHEQASPLQRLADKATAVIGQPKFLLVIMPIALLWIAVNLALLSANVVPFDPPPFNWLQGAVGLLALYVAVLILSTQRYAEQLSGYREQLTLELAILSEQKASKIIELMEEQRRDNPLIKNRFDRQADVMSTAADPEQVLDAIKEAHEEHGMSADADTEFETMARERQ